MVAADPDQQGVFVLVGDQEDRVFLVPVGPVIEVGQGDEVVVVGADHRVAGIGAGHLGRAAGAQGRKVAVQPVVERGIGDADGRVLDLELIGGAAVVQPIERTQRTQGDEVAVTGRVVDVQRPAKPPGAGIGIAAIVCVDAAGKARSGGQVDGQVGGADLGARAERRLHQDAGNVRQDQQAPFERAAGHDIAAVQAAENTVGQMVGKVGVVVQADLAVVALDHHDGHGAGLDVLGGQIGLGDEIAAPVIEVRNPGGHFPQIAQVQLTAGPEAGDGDQFGFRKKCLAAHVQRLDQHLRPRGPQVACLVAAIDPDVGNGSFRLWRRGNLLELAAGADHRWRRGQCVAGRQQDARRQRGRE